MRTAAADARQWDAFFEEARSRDRDPLWTALRREFLLPDRPWYFDGNSLGPLSRPAQRAVEETLTEWHHRAVAGWSEGNISWFDRAAWLSERLAPWFGARPAEIALGGTTTQQIHQILATFYRPTRDRFQVVVEAGTFPTDRYAVESHIRWHGLDPADALVVVEADDGPWFSDHAFDRAFTERVALALLPSVTFTTGQRLPLPAITAKARRLGIFMVWDLCHSAGLLHHRLHDDDVDAAVFCTYKYLNAGPGSPAGLFLHERHFGQPPGLWGWWGSDPTRQFLMEPTFTPAAGARGFQLGTVSPLALAPLAGSLDLLERVGPDAVEQRAEALTDFLWDVAAATLVPRGMTIRTPREAKRRGGHVALAHPQALALSRALRAVGVVPDFRPPDLIRLCPTPLATRFVDVVEALLMIAGVLDDGHFADATDNSPVW
jgi:kynureninase